MENPHWHWIAVEYQSVLFFALAEGFLGRFATRGQFVLDSTPLLALARFEHRAANGWNEPLDARFQNVIRCSRLQTFYGGLLADRPRHQQKRNLRIPRPHLLQGLESVEIR